MFYCSIIFLFSILIVLAYFFKIWVWFIVIGFLLVSICLVQFKYVLVFVLGILFSLYNLMNIHQVQKVNNPSQIVGVIASIPVKESNQIYFLFKTEKQLIRLSWRNGIDNLKVGDEWQFKVKIKKIHGLQNPGSFDFETWSLQKGLQATGSVINDQYNQYLTHYYLQYPLSQLRQLILNKIKNVMPVSATSSWLLALIVGERHGMQKADWEVLKKTGTNHLMAIAGLHIGIVSGLLGYLVGFFWRQFPKLIVWLPAQEASAYVCLISAWFYSALAGFSIPTQRACLMLTIFMVMKLIRRESSSWHVWSLSLLIVLMINPLSILTESFWLSFGTLALIIYGMSARLNAKGWWWRWGRVQWVIGFGLLPLSLVLFQEFSLVSLLVNSIAIPWLEFFILPFCLLSIFFVFYLPVISHYLLCLADKSLAVLWKILTWFADAPFSTWYAAMPNAWVLCCVITGCILLLMPRGMPGRWLSIIWLLPLLCFQYPRPDKNDLWLTVLDVGQGLSVVVQTHQHTLIYDAGPNMGGNDAGERIVLPYLRTQGIKHVDAMVISHGDNDHIGGAKAIINALPVLEIKTSVPEKFPETLVTTCLAGQHWEWDGVNFTFLYPSGRDLGLNNDSSCVLKIENSKHKVLLTGDIERYAEERLLAESADLSADILIAPHHGSKTSAIPAFLEAVHPTVVLYATGYLNRYHFPHAEVVKRYSELGVMQWNTVDTGAVFFKLSAHDGAEKPIFYRRKSNGML